MQQVFEAVSHLLPLALSEERWADPANRKEIESWLDVLAARSAALERHDMQRDAGFQFLSRSLAADIEEVRERFRSDRFAEARFFMIGSTGNCVACHSRLPSQQQFPMAKQLLSRIELDELSVHERAQILLATRQFDEALAAWESLFADPTIPPGQFDSGGYLLDYMTIGVRVRNDPDRVRKTLDTLAARQDTPAYLRRHLADWSRALVDSKRLLSGPQSIQAARDLVLDQRQSPNPLARDQTIQDLIASSLLLRLLDTELDDETRAEAYYLLGVVESRTVDSYWVPQAEVHLESAIRLAPSAGFAEDAYAVLEEYVIIGWGGESSADLPIDEWAKLTELRKLLDETSGAVPGSAKPTDP